MKPRNKNIGIIGSLLLCALLGCGDNSVSHNSGGTATETARITGTFYAKNGAFAQHATVFLRKQSMLADTSGGMPKMKAAASVSSDTVTTDNRGAFVLDSLDTGTYVVECTDNGNNLAIIDSIRITPTDSVRQLPPDTLKPAGAIKGVIRLSEGGDPRKVFVLAFGVDRFARVNADGSFKFNGLAEGKYDLRLISSLDAYGVLDTLNVLVHSADTNNMGTIELPFTGIPTPKNVVLAYDTLKQIVNLSWNKADPALTSAYYVYRRNVDSNTVFARINTSPVTDTLYSDSTGIQDETYEYRIACINKNTTEGTKSAGVSVKVVSGYQVIDTLPNGLIAESKGNVYVAQIVNNTNVSIRSYDSQLNIQNSVSVNVPLNQPQGFGLDSVGNFYFVDQRGIFKYSPSGVLLDTLDLWTNNENKTLIVYDSLVILASGVIREYSLKGDLLASSDEIPNFSADGIVVHKNQIFVGGNTNEIRTYSLGLQFVESWKLNFTQSEIAWGLTEDEQGNIYVLGYHSNPNFYTMLIYDSSKKYVGKITMDELAKHFAVSNGTIFLSRSNDLLVLKPRK